MLLWYSRPISSGPCLKLLASLSSSSSTDAFFLLLHFLLLRDARNFLNTSRPLVNEAMIDITQLETLVCAILAVGTSEQCGWQESERQLCTFMFVPSQGHVRNEWRHTRHARGRGCAVPPGEARQTEIGDEPDSACFMY